MNVSELTDEDLLNAKMRAGLAFGHPTFSDGWDVAIAFAKYIGKCDCRCKSCGIPVGMSLNYGGDIMGEYTYCKDCWAKMSKEDIQRICNTDFQTSFAQYKSKTTK
ncbi:MAG: hypothetical protein IJR86_01060 [Bacteroidaceae bacterium]|nr:hypothetical protein [Bacteroidaceae bacterium]